MLTRKLSSTTLTVDGEIVPFILKNSFIGWDHQLMIDGKEVYLSWHGFKTKIAVDGFYLGTNKPYLPLQNVPKWAYIFVVLCALIFIFAFGAVPLTLVFLGVVYSLRVSVTSKSTAVKVLLCSLITAGVWGTLILVIITL